MVTILTTYVCPLLAAMVAKIKDMHKDVKRDFGMTVSKKFYGSFKYLLTLNRIVGLFPISVTSNGDYFSLEWSWFKVITGNFFVLIFAVLTLTGLISSYHIEEVYNVRLKGLAALISTMTEILALLSTWLIGQISVSLHFKEFWKYLLCLAKTDEIIGPVEPIRKIPLLIITVFAFTLTCLGMDIYMWAGIVVPIVGRFTFIWQVVPFYFSYIFTMILEINVWITIQGLTARLQKLDNLLSNYVDFANQIGAIKLRVTLLGDCFDERKITRIGNGPTKPIDHYNMPTLHMMKKIIAAYDNISMASIALNNFYGFSLMILLVNIIACLVITPYVLYQQILNAKEYGFLFTQSYWMTCHALRLLFLIEPCHESHKQAIKLRQTIAKLAATDLPKVVYKQVKLLLLQVSENNVEFNAAGYVFINRTLIPTIGSAVFTYLAILFQYKNNT